MNTSSSVVMEAPKLWMPSRSRPSSSAVNSSGKRAALSAGSVNDTSALTWLLSTAAGTSDVMSCVMAFTSV